jgi:hypothetical protein
MFPKEHSARAEHETVVHTLALAWWDASAAG